MALVMAEPTGRVKLLLPAFTGQERRFALWAPVLIGVGIWLGFDAGIAVPLAVIGLLIVLSAFGAIVARRAEQFVLWFTIKAVLLVSLGFGAIELRRMAVDAPVLDGSFRGSVTGRVLTIDRSKSRALRVVLDQARLAGVHALATPERIRVTLVDAGFAPEPDARIGIEAVLGPPSGPAAPGAFDFSRQAYFKRIGAVGYARGSVEILGSTSSGDLTIRLTRLRLWLANALRTRIGGQEGAVAAALVVGDRSEIAEETIQTLRDSGLAHLLAISGLHIGLMSALTYWVVRLCLAGFPVFASRVSIRKCAAVAGLTAAACYLALSGFGVATQRAFVMAAVAFGAILIDRPAVTVRGLAAAACMILLLRPESLFEAGFQMSFAAAAALVAGYEATRAVWKRRGQVDGWLRRLWIGLLATVMTSVIAGLATTPFAAYHFNRLVAYGLPANVLATPVMGLWIMPCIILAAALAPLGLEGVALWGLGAGIGYVLTVAQTVSGFDGSVYGVPAGSPVALALVTFGGLWLVIWRGRLRITGIAFLIAGVLIWSRVPRPDVLIAADTALIAGRTETGALWISRERASSYAAGTWLRRDGDVSMDQAGAHARRRWNCNRRRCEGQTSTGWRVVLLRRGGLSPTDCQSRTILIASTLKSNTGAQGCTVVDSDALAGASSVAIYLNDTARPRIDIAKPLRANDQ